MDIILFPTPNNVCDVIPISFWVFVFLPLKWENTAYFMLLLLSLCSRVWLCDPIDGSPPGSPVPGGEQEHCSGLPFPSPMQESEKRKWSRSVMSDSSRPHGLQPTRLLRPWDFPGKSTGVGCHCLFQIRLVAPQLTRTRFLLSCFSTWFSSPDSRRLLLLLLSRFSRVWLFTTPWTAAYQAPPSMGFSRQE